MVSVKFAEYSRVFLSVYIKPIFDITMYPIVFKVDTGADNSTISKLDLLTLGYDIKWIKSNAVVYEEKDKPITASGEKVNAGYIKLPQINILGYEGKQWPFQIIMNENEDFHNLLGRDLLTGFNYQFNNDDDIFYIGRAKTFKPRYKFLPGQEIYEIVTNRTVQ